MRVARAFPGGGRRVSLAAILLLCLVTGVTGQRWIWDAAGQDPRAPNLRYPGLDNWPPPRRPARLRPSPAPVPTPSPSPSPAPPPTPAPTPADPARLVNGVGAPVNCSCPATQEFNPVCGTNGATYNSPLKLRCAQRCGYNVQMAHYGNCPRRTSGK